MTKAAQKELLAQEVTHATMMVMTMFDQFVLESATIQGDRFLANAAADISNALYTLYNDMQGDEDEQN